MREAAKLFDHGLRAEKEGRFEDALKYYRAAAKLEPTMRAAFNNIGVLYAKHKRPDLAIKFFTRALELGEDAAVYFNLGSEAFRLGNSEMCEKYLKRALHFEKRLFRAHLLLAYLYGKEKKLEKADIYFANALKIDPSSRPAALGFGVSLSERGKFAEALQVLDRYLTHARNDPGIQNLRAGLLLKTGKSEESLAAYQQLASTPRYASFTEHIEAARTESDTQYKEMFEEMDESIRARTKKIRDRIERRKGRLAKLAEKKAAGEPVPDTVVTAGEIRDEAKDMLDLSFMHLFSGDADRALKLLMKAKDLSDRANDKS